MNFATSAARGAGFIIALASVVALVSLGGCRESATAPGDDHPPGELPRRIELGDTVVANLVIGRDRIPDVHSFVARSDGMASVLVDVRHGSVVAAVVDSASARLLSRAEYRAGSSYSAASMPPFMLEANHVYTVSVWTSEPDSVALRYVPFLVRTAPEASSAAIGIGDVVGGETLDSLADVDEFTFTGAKGDEIIVFAQGLDATDSSSRLSVRVAYSDSTKLARYVTAAPHDPDPESHTTHTMVLPADGQYTVTVASVAQPTYDPPPPYVGPYRVEVAKVDRAPETQPATITPGDTIEGAIERVGDIDEFHIDVDEGEQFNVFFEASDPGDSSVLRLEVPTESGMRVPPVESRGSDGIVLTENATGAFTVSANDAITLRVRGASDGEELDRGPYKLFLYRVDSMPESAHPATLAPGDTISDAIDLPGDVDELPVALPTPASLNIELWRSGASLKDAPTVRLLDAAGNILVSATTPTHSSALGTGAISLPAGSYALQVFGEWTGNGAYRGPWRVVLHQNDTLPEVHSESIAPGDTVEEGSEPLGDVDSFAMPVQRGDQYEVHLQPAGIPLSMRGDLQGMSSTYAQFVLDAAVPGAPTLLESPRTNRIDIQEDGIFTLRVGVAQLGATPPPYGRYRFVVTRFSGAVEHHTPTIVLGDVVDDEELDFAGDLDEFTLVGAPGAEATVIFDYNEVQVFDLDTRQVIAEVSRSFGRRATGRFRLPASGRMGLRFMEPPRPYGLYSVTGPYSFRVMKVDRAPESVAAGFSIGDTVSGESVEFSGDVDEFAFSAEAGDRLRAFFDVTNGTSYFGRLTLEVSPAGSDSVLGSVWVMNPEPELDVGTPVITIPASGPYTVRVHWTDENQATDPDQPTAYRFQLRREP